MTSTPRVVDFSSYQTIAVERKQRILTITLNRPDVLNATDKQMHEELSRIFVDARVDETTDVIVLTGAGRAFSAGGDVELMQELIDEPRLQWWRSNPEGKKLIFSILDCEKPIIARVNGDAIGLGATIALFCDIVVAAQSARFGDPHVKVGLVAGDGGAVIWPQLVGFHKAKEFLMLGSLVTATEAERIGLINHVVPDAELDAKVDELANRLAGGAIQAIRWTKAAVNVPLKRLAQEILDVSFTYGCLANLTADHQEAVNAFREKRKPQFTGR